MVRNAIGEVMRRACGWVVLLSCAAPAFAATVTTFSPQGEVAQVRQVRATFSESMVPFGDLRQPDPFLLQCPAPGAGRWADDKTWIFDFKDDLPPGTRCSFALRPEFKSIGGNALTAATYKFNTGGPAVVRAYPNQGQIEEGQYFALLLNGAVDASSIEQFASCEASGITERIGVSVVTGSDRDAVLKATNLSKLGDRSVVIHCRQDLPSGAKVAVVWGKGIKTPSGIATTADHRLNYMVRAEFTASFTCERENAQADCLPIRPMRVEFSTAIPRSEAERIVLVAPDGKHTPQFEHNRGEESEGLLSFVQRGYRKTFLFFGRNPGSADADPSQSGVTAVEFQPAFPEAAAISIEIPANLVDESGRPLSNASLFPIHTKTALAPAIVKFAQAPFGILELNAEPLLPVTVRSVEGDLQVTKKTVAPTAAATPGVVSELRLTDDASIIQWMSRARWYHEGLLSRPDVEADLGIKLPPVPPLQRSTTDRKSERYGEETAAHDTLAQYVQTRTIGLLNRESNVAKIALPAIDKADPRPFEVVGIPLPKPGFYVVEIESKKLGDALLDTGGPMFVRTTALVTNLGVHFKLGLANSGIWVTTLDHGTPVADATLQISDCMGKPLWNGKTDANGFSLVDMRFPRDLYRQCQGRGAEPSYFVSARKTDALGRADMAFALSSWDEGIEPWRFALAVGGGGSRTESLVAHTVFDRPLFRAGETVSMKHFVRRLDLKGLSVAASGLPDTMTITHEGSGQTFDQPLDWRRNAYAENTFAIPKDAKLGTYSVELKNGPLHQTMQTGSFRVEEFRLPVLTGMIVPPKTALIQPAAIPITVQVNYGSGGPASGLPVRLSAQLHTEDAPPGIATDHFPGFTFTAPRKNPGENEVDYFREDYVGEDDDTEGRPRNGTADSALIADKIALVLDKSGAGNVTLTKLPPIVEAREMVVEATYADPNGEIQTLSQTVPVWPSGVVLGLKADEWTSERQTMNAQVLALGTDGKPRAGQAVTVRAFLHQVTTTRKRLVGGFYSYDNQHADVDLGEVCSGTADTRGLVFCNFSVARAGQIELVASASDSSGHGVRVASSVYVTRRGEVWFGGENDDRMDVLPEQHEYAPGQTARFQVRMPFRSATALIAIERDGILETRTVTLSGKDPTIELPVKPEWAPNVFVSVLAVRGRIVEVPWYSFFVWGWHKPVDWWHAWRGDADAYQAPTAMVDLSRPAFRLGIGEIAVGTAAHRLKVEVTPDKPTYQVRATSKVHVQVHLPDGSVPPAGSEVAIAAVDMSLLELMPNTSWQLLNAMIEDRAYDVMTSTAQMQIIGKRHFGKKAAPAGGGGGQFPTRELFDTLLLWNGKVALDANGAADVAIPLNDSLTRFKIVAIADVLGTGDVALFGTGSAEITATQDLQLISGLPPVAREGDRMRALVTVRNTTTAPMAVKVNAVADGLAVLVPQQVTLAAGESRELGWDVEVPFNVTGVSWTFTADAGNAHDRLKIAEKVVEAIPVRVLQATLMQLDKTVTIPVSAPRDAVLTSEGIARGSIEVALKPSLADGLPGVRDWLSHYPWPCIEQRASVAIGLRDEAQWKSVAQALPLYLDADGLLDYFPPMAGGKPDGSPILTAYVLSASDEATHLGYDFTIPADTRTKMQEALLRFVDGRIKRDDWVPAFIRNGGLDQKKLSALEALSRSSLVKPALLSSIEILPNQWPTSSVIDWLLILRRTEAIPKRAERIAEAEQILRARLNFQGTRMGFSTERDDNWWWFMSNADVNSNRILFAVLDADSWREDVPRLVTGALQRQDRGRWSTTVANVWGSLAIESFSKRFEKESVTGATKAAIEGAANGKVLDWGHTPSGGVLAFAWPKMPPTSPGAKATDAMLTVSQTGTGKPWVTFTSRAAIPLTAPLSSGYRITKTIAPTEEKTKGKISRGDVWRVHVEVDAQADATWVVLDDPVPTGATILGSGLGRDSSIATTGEEEAGAGELAYQERSFTAYRAYYRYVAKGKFAIDYSVRINNPGHFNLPPTRVEAMYAPEMFGELPNAAVTVEPLP